jgi:hypothetical protein
VSILSSNGGSNRRKRDWDGRINGVCRNHDLQEKRREKFPYQIETKEVEDGNNDSGKASESGLAR